MCDKGARQASLGRASYKRRVTVEKACSCAASHGGANEEGPQMMIAGFLVSSCTQKKGVMEDEVYACPAPLITSRSSLLHLNWACISVLFPMQRTICFTTLAGCTLLHHFPTSFIWGSLQNSVNSIQLNEDSLPTTTCLSITILRHRGHTGNVL